MAYLEAASLFSVLGDAVRRLGTADFGDTLMEAVRCVAPFDNGGLLAFRMRDEKPVPLAVSCSNPDFKHAYDEYVNRYFAKCPIAQAFMKQCRSGSLLVVRSKKSEIAGWKDSFYTPPLSCHLGIFSRSESRFLYMGLARSHARDRFTDDDEDRLRSLWPFIEQSVAKNIQLTNVIKLNSDGEVDATASLTGMFTSRGLSRREAEVCAHAVSGLSAAATAGAMDISINTVSTLRQRAYCKLNIRSHSELYALCLHQMEKSLANPDAGGDLWEHRKEFPHRSAHARLGGKLAC